MKKKNILSLFCVVFGALHLLGQETTKNISKLNAIKKTVKLHAAQKDYVSAIKFAKKITPLLHKKNEIAHHFYSLGYYYKKNNQIDSAYVYYSRSKNTYLDLNDSIKIAARLLNMAKIESTQEFYGRSDSTAIAALKYLKNKKSIYNTSIYNCLGINSKNQHQYNEAIHWYNLAINTVYDSVKKLRYVSNKAINYRYLKEYQKSTYLYKKIIKSTYYDSIPLSLKSKIIDNYAFVRFLNNEKVIAKDFLKAQDLKRQLKDNYGLITNYSYLSDFYKEKDKKTALTYAYKMYYLSKKVFAQNDRVKAIDKIILLKESSNIKTIALERSRLSDSLQIAKQLSSNKFAKVIYNYEEEKRLKLLAQIGLEKQKAQNLWMMFLGIVFLIIFVGYLIYRKQKSIKEKIEEVYKTETRLAKKIHDELANDVYHAMNKAQSIIPKNKELLESLERIYTQTRNISHENSFVVTGSNYEESLKQLFLDFTNEHCKIINKNLSKMGVNTLPKEKQIVLFRVFQELLINTTKHSKATLVVVNFEKNKKNIQVTYKDNGIGVKTLKIKNGLYNMETRIKSIGGSIIFDSEEQKGFKAVFKIKNR